MPPIADLLADHLSPADGRSVRDLMRALKADPRTARIPRTQVERALAGDARFTRSGDGPKAVWELAGDAPTPPPAHRRTTGGLPRAVDAGDPLAGLDLRDWQVEAFAAWAAAGMRGVVEAVTGTGKTRLAVAAVRVALAHDGRVLVVVPTLDLVDQWTTELRRLVPGARLGRLGGGDADDLHDHHVVVATPHSAAAVPFDVPAGHPGLLVADEAHRYGAPTWGAALRPDFGMRLALTATYERNDDGIEDVLGPYFGAVVCAYGYERAVPDGVVAPFRIAFAGTALEEHERATYDELDRRVRQLHRDLVGTYGFSRDPRRLFAAVAATVAAAEGDPSRRRDPRVAACREYLFRVRTRRDVAATAAGKLDVVAALAPGIARHADRTLVFTDTVDQAEQAARLLCRAGVPAETVSSELPEKQRRIRLAQFRNGNLRVVVAPRVLDEGVDVPAADVAIVLAAFRTRRQMIQRLGRVLRLKDDGRPARLVVAFAKDTREDPADGAHEGFLREVVPVAAEVTTFDADTSRTELADWLAVER
ncbi:MAG: DEAD/DEAH box helicase [Actinobacteria bacterium]|nr:DEAD/DEAH box helicase [Actinomycetota bacterium]